MWLADKWKDYRLVDTASGEKLEYWGDYLLRRPEPQAVWEGFEDENLWNSSNAHYHRSASGGGHWEYRKKGLPERWTINYRDLTFNIKPMGFKHTGLFPEQAVNWQLAAELIKKENREISVLNMFAYTGGATVACLNAGAKVTHVDASKGMVQWAKENAVASSLADKPVRWLVDDCLKFVKREIRRGNKYDAIIMDPPSYGRGPTGEVWKIEDSIGDFLELCRGVLSDDPLFVLLNSYTTGLASSTMAYLLHLKISAYIGGSVDADEIGLVTSSTGMPLGCGASARWTK